MDDYGDMYSSGIYGDDSNTNFDTQVNDMYSGSPVDTSWIGQKYSDYQLDNPGYTNIPQYNTGVDPTEGFWSSSQPQSDGSFLGGQSMAPEGWLQSQDPFRDIQSAGTDWAGMLKGGTDFLGKLFTNGTGGYGGSGGSTNTFLKGLAGLLAAQQTKKSNQQMSQQIPQTVNSVRQFAAPYDVSSTGAGMMQPGATTMRDAAQQQAAMANQRLQSFRANPNSDAGYKATNDQIANVLNRQAAMHGNRNNFNATAPAMLAAQAAAQLKYDQNYQQDLNSWDTRSGANISPVQASGLEALMRGQQYGAQGNSPYYDALGKILNTNSYENNPAMQAIMEKINKALA